MSEFSLIEKYFKNQAISRPDVFTGIGDDCAIMNVPDGMSLAVSMDTLVSGVHFPVTTAATDIGYKSLAVNLSDLAAMGAIPAWVTLSLTMPEENDDWLSQFMQGFNILADKYQLQLIGGDTTSGPLSITIQAHGFVNKETALLRNGAQPGDLIYVSGTLGDAGLGLLIAMADKIEPRYCLLRLNRPTPQLELGQLLQGVASSCIDISDGLIQDATHICHASNCGATISSDQLPLSSKLKNALDYDDAVKLALTAGDDYELCFTVSPEYESRLADITNETGVQLTKIGCITTGNKVTVHDLDNVVLTYNEPGYQHFK